MCAMSDDSPSQPAASPAAASVALVSCGSQTESTSRSPPAARSPEADAAGSVADEEPTSSQPRPGPASRLASLWSGGWPLSARRAEKSTQTCGEPVQSEADRLARDVVQHVLGTVSTTTGDPVARTLRLATDEILAKHRLLLNGMVSRLQIRRDTCYDTFVSVADELFADNTVTWARIITLYAFGARLALYCQEKEMADFVPEITRFLGMYVTEHLGGFVREQGGWSEMCRHFQYPESVENTVLTVLVKLGVGLGLAATATFLTTSR